MKDPNYFIPDRGFTLPIGEDGFTIYYYAIIIVCGIILATALILLELVTTENFGVPLMAPFSPVLPRDLKDSIVKSPLRSLRMRPAVFNGPDRRRMK